MSPTLVRRPSSRPLPTHPSRSLSSPRARRGPAFVYFNAIINGARPHRSSLSLSLSLSRSLFLSPIAETVFPFFRAPIPKLREETRGGGERLARMRDPTDPPADRVALMGEINSWNIHAPTIMSLRRVANY
jgi:hypothetical protein